MPFAAEQVDQGAVAFRFDAPVMLQRGVQRVREKAQRGERKRAGATRRVAQPQLQNPLRRLRRPRLRRRVLVWLAVGVRRRIERQRAQRALHRGHGEAGAGVEAAGTLARAAPAHQIPLAGQHHAGHQLLRLAAKRFLERTLASLLAHRRHQPGHARRPPRPSFRSRAVVVAAVFYLCRCVLRRVCCGFVFGCRGGSRVRGGRFLQAREQRLQRVVLHRLQTRERQRRLIAHGEEDHRVAGGRRLQLVVQQALVDDADVFGREIGEIHWHVRADAAAALANAHGGAGEQAQHSVNVAIVAALALEARRLEHGERLG